MAKVYDTLTFGGGGEHSYAYITALKTLQKDGRLGKIKKLAGTSAGVMVGSLIATGYCNDDNGYLNIETLKERFETIDFKSVRNKRFFLFEYWDLLTKGSMTTDDTLIKEFDKLVLSCNVNPDITMKGLYEHSGIEFTITACCVTSSNYIKYFNHELTPETKFRDAFMAAVSVPPLTQPVKIGRHYYIDGGLKENISFYYRNIDTNLNLCLITKEQYHRLHHDDPHEDHDETYLGFKTLLGYWWRIAEVAITSWHIYPHFKDDDVLHILCPEDVSHVLCGGTSEQIQKIYDAGTKSGELFCKRYNLRHPSSSSFDGAKDAPSLKEDLNQVDKGKHKERGECFSFDLACNKKDCPTIESTGKHSHHYGPYKMVNEKDEKGNSKGESYVKLPEPC